MNRVFLIGNLTRDPEVKYLQSGDAVANLRVAVSKKYTTTSGEKRESVLYIGVTVWKAQAENAGKYLEKGSKVAVEGELQSRDWTAKDGGKRTEIEVGNAFVEYLSFKKDGGGARAGAESGAAASGSPAGPQGDEDVPF